MTPSNDSKIIDLTIRIGFLAIFIFGTLMLVAPLVGLVSWAVILCVAVFPFHSMLTGWLGGRKKLSATLITLLGLVITIGPVALMTGSILDVGRALTEDLTSGTLRFPPPNEAVMGWPVIGEQVHAFWTKAHSNLASVVAQYGQEILAAMSAVLGKLAGVGLGLLSLALAVIIMGVLLVAGPNMIDGLHKFAERVFSGNGAALINMAGATVRNVSRGVIGVAVIQALLAGIVMGVFGMKTAGLLALVVLILGIIQVGPAIVLIPVIIWAWTAMDTGQALIFTVLMVPVTLMDNVLKPIWMARGLDTPMLVILIGVLGGLMAFGLVGIFVGPVILSVFHKLFTFWLDNDPDNAAAASGEADAPVSPES